MSVAFFYYILLIIVRCAASASKWKVFVMDPVTTRIVSSCLTMFEVMEHQISLVENLNLKRQSFPDMEAVYFICPTMESVKHVMDDFISPSRAAELPNVDGKPVNPTSRYSNVHLIFNGTVWNVLYIDELFISNTLLICRLVAKWLNSFKLTLSSLAK